MNNSKKEIDIFLKELSKVKSDYDYGLAIPFVYLDYFNKSKDKKTILAAQNCFHEANGAYTGEISLPMLKDIGVKFSIIGHSERREIFQESDDLINKKLLSLLKNNFTPILCIGESLKQRQENKTKEIIKKQIDLNLQNVNSSDVNKIIFAYEPIWAIGTGKTATSLQAQEACQFIRNYIESKYNKKIADKVRIQYGGSVKPDNIKEILNQEDIDGALVGGASLQIKDFIALLN